MPENEAANAQTDRIATSLSSYELLANPMLNKGTAFSDSERNVFDLHGLLPPNVGALQARIGQEGHTSVSPDENRRSYSQAGVAAGLCAL